MRLMAMVLVVLTACSPATWNHVDTAALIVSDATLTADAVFTLGAAGDRWSGREEGGMLPRYLLGPTPSPAAVGMYFFSAIAINTAIWVVLPRRWRSAVPAMITGVQAATLGWNYAGCRWCLSATSTASARR